MNIAIDPEALEEQNRVDGTNTENHRKLEFHFNVPPSSFDGNESVADFLDQMYDFVLLLSKLANHEGILGTMTVDIMNGLDMSSEFLRTGKTGEVKDWSSDSAPELIDEVASRFGDRLRDDLDEGDLALVMRIANHALRARSNGEEAR